MPKVTALPSATVRFVKESRAELRKVSWPSRQTTIRYTLIIVSACVVVGFAIGGLDFLLTKILEQLLF